ncbi:glycosyltransferase [Chitinophaga horti]|uniref:Glycosyltransferase n=1 Tax=Chitinophaga horti TaxID=2920382 RepID=A0ABY6J2T3_9BACT|nr:glycosyltransferase [Chitinophaga horti]UYQ92477.1 glycosyltransferase [Chitinophaga horti]
MRIIIQASWLLVDSPADTGHVYWDFLYALCGQHPEVQFFLVVDSAWQKKLPLPANATVVEKVAGTGAMGQWWWRNYTWPSLVKKYEADLALVIDDVLPTRAGVPTWLVLMHQAAPLRSKDAEKYIGNYRGVITLSNWMKQQVLDKHPGLEDRVHTLAPGSISAIRPVEWEEREEFKRELTGGVEYFAAVGSFHPDNNILPLLKAFSKLKGRLHSNLKLVIAGRATRAGAQLADSLASYRYRDDVVWVKDATSHRLARLIASAYAVVHVATQEGVALPVLAAQVAQVPVVALAGGTGQEAGGEAALYAETGNIDELAEKMGALYKDEMLRNRLLSQIPPTAAEAGWQRFSAAVWELMLPETPVINN